MVDWAFNYNYLSMAVFRPDITVMVDWAFNYNYLSMAVFRPDITVMVDWVLKYNYLSMAVFRSSIHTEAMPSNATPCGDGVVEYARRLTACFIKGD